MADAKGESERSIETRLIAGNMRQSMLAVVVVVVDVVDRWRRRCHSRSHEHPRQ